MARKERKERIDRLVVARGLAASRDRAKALVMAGKVRVDGSVVTKAGTMVAEDAVVDVSEPDHPYVSRGALKLEKALDEFGIDPAGMVAMDVGASTGGFTDVLLRRGAKKVYAIDVGYGQLAWSLRNDGRVVVLERENIRHTAAETIPEPCDLAVIDVSFISLTLVLENVARLLRGGGKPIVCLVKPQFEAGKDQVGKGGVVRDEAVRLETVERVRQWAQQRGWQAGDFVESPIRGPAGNVEYLLILRTPDAAI